MKMLQFWTSGLRVVKTNVDWERENGKLKEKVAQSLNAISLDESVAPYLESASNYIKFTCEGLISFSVWKSDLVMWEANSDWNF